MASSCHNTHKDYNYPCPLNPMEEEEEKEEEEEDLLELGLGISSTTTCRKKEHNQSNTVSGSGAASSSSLQFHAQQHIGLGLDLRLGIGYHNGGGVRGMDVAPPSNYNTTSLWKDQGQEDHDYYDMAKSSSSSSWPWLMGSSSSFLGLHDWQMPVSIDSHNCSIPTITTTRPHTGLWFTLRSTTNRAGEVLPQIPTAYIRVKDENVTVFMVKKYLVRKLGLSNEAEIDIWCMGQKLLQRQTLKQVRDCVWVPGLVESVQHSTTISFGNSLNASVHHLMSLQYVPRRVLN